MRVNPDHSNLSTRISQPQKSDSKQGLSQLRPPETGKVPDQLTNFPNLEWCVTLEESSAEDECWKVY